ncbi:hypothetical protein CRG98_033113 [Punica granatum]|uniref:Uncharacterized protein n=1 Tax=Punica granatum TaxID=22663 RepID=A0A2I0IR75_PUNGR|nr:hypothetical protein CRG98_033113 [Punica granatum]
MSPVESPSCAHSKFNIVGARMREAYATRLGSIHLPGDARRTHMRRSRHSLFTTRRSRAAESLGSWGTVRTRISSRRGTHARSLRNAAWEYPPSRGRATDAHEKESPLTVYDP